MKQGAPSVTTDHAGGVEAEIIAVLEGLRRAPTCWCLAGLGGLPNVSDHNDTCKRASRLYKVLKDGEGSLANGVEYLHGVWWYPCTCGCGCKNVVAPGGPCVTCQTECGRGGTGE